MASAWMVVRFASSSQSIATGCVQVVAATQAVISLYATPEPRLAFLIRWGQLHSCCL